jgi:putative phage-type endonuclease
MSKVIANISKLSREDWLQLRKAGIGGSDAAACMGLSPWKSKLSLYTDKQGISEDTPDNEHFRMGRDLEDYCAKRFQEASGKKIRNDNQMYQDDEYDFMFANIDRVVVGEDAGLECKIMADYTAKSYGLTSDSQEQEIPLQYYCQIQHYMMVTGKAGWYIAFLILPFGGLKWMFCPRDDDFIERLRTEETDFWRSYVDVNIPPEADGSDSSMEALRQLYPKSSETRAELPAEVDQLLDMYTAAKEQEAAFKKRKQEMQARVVSVLKDAGYGTTDSYNVSYKSQSRTTLDSKRLKADMPDIFEKYSSTSDTRVFRVKKINKKGDK